MKIKTLGLALVLILASAHALSSEWSTPYPDNRLKFRMSTLSDTKVIEIRLTNTEGKWHATLPICVFRNAILSSHENDEMVYIEDVRNQQMFRIKTEIIGDGYRRTSLRLGSHDFNYGYSFISDKLREAVNSLMPECFS